MKTLLTAALLSSCLCASAAEVVNLSAAQQTALGIATAPARAVPAGVSPPLPARVTVPTAQLQVIAAPQEGVIETLLVAEGESVSAGQELARIQSPRLLELQSDYLETHARHQLADGNYRRDRQLHQEGIIAERRLRESEAELHAQAAALARLRHVLALAGMDDAALDALRTRGELSGSLTVRAPYAGAILEQMAAVGERVAAADPLYQLAQLQPLWLEVHVPLQQAAGVQPGQRVVIPDLDLSAQVVAIGQRVHGVDQGVLIRAEISAGAERLRPGQFVQVQLEAGTGTHSLRVPRSAVFYAQERRYVFSAVPEGFRAVEVRIVAEEPTHLLVQGELGADSRIAISGVAAVKAAWLGNGE